MTGGQHHSSGDGSGYGQDYPVSNGYAQPSKLPAVLASHGRFIPLSCRKLPGESRLIGDQ
jgi:hypothetical protein